MQSKPLIQWERDVITRIIKRQNQFHLVQARIAHEAHSPVGQPEIKSRLKVGGPILEALKVTASSHVSQKCFHKNKNLPTSAFLSNAADSHTGVKTP
jgi:hypothetical protein